MFSNIILAAVLLGSSFSERPRTMYSAQSDAASLKGLKSVYVSVQYDAPPQPQAGLAGDDLCSEVELTLRANGIGTVNRRAWKQSAGKPFLFVHIVGNTLNPDRPSASYFFTLNVELIQQVELNRKPRVKCEGVTWSEATTIVLPYDKLRTIAVQLQSLASDFSRAVEEANPGKSARL